VRAKRVMISVEWKFDADDDRVLILLPPLTQSVLACRDSDYSIVKTKIRGTIDALIGNPKVQYVVAHIAGFKSRDFSKREDIEEFYGCEVRLLQNIDQLHDASFLPFITSSCIYVLQYEDDWLSFEETRFWRSFFDICILEQLYPSYDRISTRIITTIGSECDIVMGKQYVMESFNSIMIIGEKWNPLATPTPKVIGGMHQNDTEGDVVLVIGQLSPYELEFASRILKHLIQECRLTAYYVFGNAQELASSLNTTYPDVAYKAFATNALKPTDVQWLWSRLKKHIPKYNSYVFWGAFEFTNEDTYGIWQKLESSALQSCVFTPESWHSLHENGMSKKESFVLTLEPIGLLYNITNSRLTPALKDLRDKAEIKDDK